MKPKAKPVRKRAQKAEAKAPAASVIEHIKDLKPDQKNARKHNPRNIGMIEKALQEVGAARSIVIDEDNNILAGNGTIEAAAQAGITKLQIVDADGETIIAVRRTGLTKKQKTRLAIFDNKTTDESEWDYDVLVGLDADVLEGMNIEMPDGVDFSVSESNDNTGDELTTCPKCGFQWRA